MASVLAQLQRLWYIILTLAVASLITDITLVVQQSFGVNERPYYDMMPLPLVPDIATILIFAYFIWGQSNPFLLPGSYPNSKPWVQKARVAGTLLLMALWVSNAIVNAKSTFTARRVMAAVCCFQTTLICIELIGRNNLTKHQRRALKQELQYEMDNATQVEDNLDSEAHVASETSVQQAKTTSASPSPPSQVRADDGRVLEIVRPEAVDPSAVAFSQQLLYEMYQRQYYHQYQMHMLHQNTQEEANGTGEDQAGIEVRVWDEGKLDDPSLLDSSPKVEMDEPTPLAQPSAPPLQLDSINTSDLPTPPPLGSVKEPSAPALPEGHSHQPGMACDEEAPRIRGPQGAMFGGSTDSIPIDECQSSNSERAVPPKADHVESN